MRHRRFLANRYGYLLAFVAVSLALAVHVAFQPVAGDRMPFITLLAAVAFAAWISGRNAALMAMTLSAACAAFVIQPHVFLLPFADGTYMVGLFLFVGVSLAIIAMFHEIQKAFRQSDEARNALEDESAARKRAEASLMAASDRFRLAVEAVNGIVYEYDINSRTVECTRGLMQVLGYRDEEAEATVEWWLNRIHPDDQQRCQKEFSAALRAGHNFVVNYRVHHKDGRWLHLEDRAVVIKDAEGHPLKMIGCAVDVSLRIAAITALQRSEQMFRSLVTVSSQAVLRYKIGAAPFDDLDDAATVWWRVFTGQSETQPAAKDEPGWLWPVHPDDRPTAISFWTQLIGSRAPVASDYRVRRHDGQWRLVRVQATPLVGIDCVVEWACLLNDVTDERAAELALSSERTEASARLQRSIDELRFVADNAPVLIARCDRQLRYRFVNRPYANRFGLLPQEIVGMRIDKTIGPAAWAVIAQHVELVLRGISHDFDVEIPYTAEGHKFMRCRYVPERDEGGSVIGFVAAITDISDRKLIEDAMRASEQRLRLVIDSALDYAIITLDDKGIVTSWSSGAKQLTGFDEADALHQHVRMLYTPEDRAQEAPEKDLARAAASGRADNAGWRVRKDGSRIWASGSVMRLQHHSSLHDPSHPLSIDAGVHGYLLMTQDLTNQRLSEEQREITLQRLQQADNRKDEFLAIAAHELRNPLGVLLNGIEMMSRMAERDTVEQRPLELMQRQGLRMMRLLSELLDSNRIARGEIELVKHRMPLAALLEESVELSRVALEVGGHQLVQAIDTDEMIIEGDSMWLIQVFANLLTNAAKYTPQGGCIRLIARRQSLDAVVEVQDNGIGIAAARRAKVFDLYAQADSLGSNSASGIGLGLALARRLVERHNGCIEVNETAEGVGACFTVRLPLLHQAEQEDRLSR